MQEEGLEVWRRRQSLQASGGVAPNQEASRETTTETAGTDRETGGTQHSVFVYVWEKSFTRFMLCFTPQTCFCSKYNSEVSFSSFHVTFPFSFFLHTSLKCKRVITNES